MPLGQRARRARQNNQTPVICPASFTSIDAARETFGSPGISIMFPEITTTNPAPAEREASVTRSVHPVGAPRILGSSVNEYCVLAMHTGNFPYPHPENCRSFVLATSLKATSAAP